jgi:acyl-CoA synthetase (AMP-forming)/AMP-acid ligase II
MALWDQVLESGGSAWVWDGGQYERISYAEHFAAGRRVAASLKRRGVRPGDVVGAVVTNSLASIHGFLGAWFAGATVASLPIIARGQSIEQYVALLRKLCESVGAESVLIESRFAGFLEDAGLGAEPAILRYEDLDHGGDVADIEPPGEDEVMFIQFSSGTTAEPRGVELTGSMIDAQLRLLADRMSAGPGDVGVMWLPLSHDMGFFGGDLFAWYTGMQGVQSTPERFLSQPWTWFEDCARWSATITVGPPFAYAVAARGAGERTLPGPLSLRLCIVGSELINLSHLESCVAAFEPYGLSLSAFSAAYGLAEATLGVSFGAIDSEPRRIWVDSGGLAEGRLSICDQGDSGATSIVSSGTPLPGFSVSHPGEVGELLVSGPSLARGYRGQPELTAARFRDGAFATGDLGFMHEGELYVVGREDDRLIVAGRNIDVADLEEELAEDPRVRKGNCAVVDVRSDAGQKIVVVAEAAPDADRSELLRTIRTVAARRHGLRVDDLVVLDRGQFPKTPSGKAQRYRCRELAKAE